MERVVGCSWNRRSDAVEYAVVPVDSLFRLPAVASGDLSKMALPARAQAIADLEALGQPQLFQAAHATFERRLVHACLSGKFSRRAARVPADQIEDAACPRAAAVAAVEPVERGRDRRESVGIEIVVSRQCPPVVWSVESEVDPVEAAGPVAQLCEQGGTIPRPGRTRVGLRDIVTRHLAQVFDDQLSVEV